MIYSKLLVFYDEFIYLFIFVQVLTRVSMKTPFHFLISCQDFSFHTLLGGPMSAVMDIVASDVLLIFFTEMKMSGQWCVTSW